MTAFRNIASSLLKWWHLVLLAIVAVAVLVLGIYLPRVGGTILSIVNGESSVGFWMHKVGLSFRGAETVAMSVSTAENVVWFVLFMAMKRFFTTKIKPFYDKIVRCVDPTTFNGESEWVRSIYAFGYDMLRFLVPPLPAEDGIAPPSGFAFRLYLRIARYGFIPTYIFTGVGYSVALASRKLVNIFAAAFIVIVANCAKMYVCGYVSRWLSWWMPLVVFWIGPAVVLQFVRRVRKNPIPSVAA